MCTAKECRLAAAPDQVSFLTIIELTDVPRYLHGIAICSGAGLSLCARQSLILFLFAIFFAYLINPAVERLQNLVRGRGRAIALIYLLLLTGLGAARVLCGSKSYRQAARLGEAWPELTNKVTTGQIAIDIGQKRRWSTATQNRIKDVLENHSQELVVLAQRIGVTHCRNRQKCLGAVSSCPSWQLSFFVMSGISTRFLVSLVQSRAQREFLPGCAARSQPDVGPVSFRAQLNSGGVVRCWPTPVSPRNSPRTLRNGAGDAGGDALNYSCLMSLLRERSLPADLILLTLYIV